MRVVDVHGIIFNKVLNLEIESNYIHELILFESLYQTSRIEIL